MAMCEKCWADAYSRHLSNSDKSQTEHYNELVAERKDNPCDINEANLAQWVISNRYPKSENDKVSDFEMYNYILLSVRNRKELMHELISERDHQINELDKEIERLNHELKVATSLINEYENTTRR